MYKILGEAYTYDDLCIRPCYDNHVDSSRTKEASRPDVKTKLFRKNKKEYVEIDCPILNAPMDTVISFDLADVLIEFGSIPIFNRGRKDHKEIYERYGRNCIISTGANVDEASKIIHAGFDKILIDVANGHTRRMEKVINLIKKRHSHVLIMAGNVCTGRAYNDLVNWGADCVRVGIGPGAACTTRMVTAVGVPQMTAILDIAEEAEQRKVPFVADGGIKSSREVCLALAGGANTVMLGKMLALTEESGAEKRNIVGYTPLNSDEFIEQNPPIREAKFRGQASEDYQKDHYGGLRPETVAEGVDFWAPVTGSATDVITELLAGLRSSMTYCGSYHLKEYREKTKFYKVMNTYNIESNPRPN